MLFKNKPLALEIYLKAKKSKTYAELVNITCYHGAEFDGPLENYCEKIVDEAKPVSIFKLKALKTELVKKAISQMHLLDENTYRLWVEQQESTYGPTNAE